MVISKVRKRDAPSTTPADRPWRNPASWKLQSGYPSNLEAEQLPKQRPHRRRGTQRSRPVELPTHNVNEPAEMQATWLIDAIAQEDNEANTWVPLCTDHNSHAVTPFQPTASDFDAAGSQNPKLDLDHIVPHRSVVNEPERQHTSSSSRSLPSATSSKQEQIFDSITMVELSASPAPSAPSDDLNQGDTEIEHSLSAHRRDNSIKLLACPYAKFDPFRFSRRNDREPEYRNCGSSYLRDIARLRQHLLRVHVQPDNFCTRCSTRFSNAKELQEHVCKLPCEAQNSSFMNESQRLQIKHTRAISKDPVKSWFAIFNILFPKAPRPMSPFADYQFHDAHGAFVDLMKQFYEPFSDKLRQTSELSSAQKLTVQELFKQTQFEMARRLQKELSGERPADSLPYLDFINDTGLSNYISGDQDRF